MKALQNTRAILLSGEPINESLAFNDPFAINTQTEIIYGPRDREKVKIGILIENL